MPQAPGARGLSRHEYSRRGCMTMNAGRVDTPSLLGQVAVGQATRHQRRV